MGIVTSSGGVVGSGGTSQDQINQILQITNFNSNLPYASVGTKDTDKYATVKEAIDIGESYILISQDTTETGNIVVTKDTCITILPNVNWNLGDNNIQIQGNDIEFSWVQEPYTSSIVLGFTSTKALVETSGTNNKFIYNNINADFSGCSANDCILFDSNISKIASDGVNIISLPNQSGCGVHVSNSQGYMNTGVLMFKQEGVSRNNCYNFYSSYHYDSLVLNGLFDTVNKLITTNGGKQKIKVIDSLAETYKLEIGSVLEGIEYQNDLASFDINIIKDRASVVGVNLNGGSLYGQNFSGLKISKCYSTGNLDLSDVGSDSNFIDNCEFNSIILGGNNSKISSSKFNIYTDNGSNNAKVGVEINNEISTLDNMSLDAGTF